MLAHAYERAARCQMCGSADWEWDPAQGGKKYAYEPVAVTCRGCQVKDIAADGSERVPGVRIELRPTGTREWAQRQVLQQRRAARRRREAAR